MPQSLLTAWSILKKSRHIRFGVFIVRSSMEIFISLYNHCQHPQSVSHRGVLRCPSHCSLLLSASSSVIIHWSLIIVSVVSCTYFQRFLLRLACQIKLLYSSLQSPFFVSPIYFAFIICFIIHVLNVFTEQCSSSGCRASAEGPVPHGRDRESWGKLPPPLPPPLPLFCNARAQRLFSQRDVYAFASYGFWLFHPLWKKDLGSKLF